MQYLGYLFKKCGIVSSSILGYIPDLLQQDQRSDGLLK